jgi:hypothetical protein
MHQGSLAPVTRQTFEAYMKEVEAQMRRLRWEIETLTARVDELQSRTPAA